MHRREEKRLKGFMNKSLMRELEAQTDLQQPSDAIDEEIDIDYELEIEIVAAEESKF